jgi:hypothetical protein
MDKKEIYRYFIDLTKDQQVVFLDVINDLLTSQVTFTRLKEKYKDFSKFEKQMFK